MMKVKKIKINGYDTYIYKTNKYATIYMRFLFEMPYTRENIFKYDLLEEYMIYAIKGYETRKEVNRRRMELYEMNYGFDNFNVGEKMFVALTFSFYDPAILKDDYLAEALKFARCVLFEPKVIDGHLDREELERSREVLIADYAENLMSFKKRAHRDLITTLYPNSYKTVDLLSTREEYEDIMKSFEDAELIDAHKRLIDETLVGLAIMGNVKEDFIENVEKLFKFPSVGKLDDDYHDYLPIASEVEEFYHKVDEDYSESVVRAVYSYETVSAKDKMAYLLISHMMSSSGMLLHKVLRDELGIVYSSSSSSSKHLDILTMSAVISRDNLKLAIDGFDEVIERLKKPEILSKLLSKVKEEFELVMYTFDESKWNVFHELFDTSFGFDLSLEEKGKIIKSLTCEDIQGYLNKLKKRTIHFYEGGKK